jgi:thymidylate synthase (FAD)
MTIEIKTSRAIAAQILRHRSFSFQEFSQRYSTTSSIVDVDIRKQAETNRQSSEESFNPIIGVYGPSGDVKYASDAISEHMAAGMRLYAELLTVGVAKESARMILPLATETTLYMSGTIRSWIHYLDLRTDDDTQLEHRQIALEIKEIFKTEFPDTYDALWGT